LPTDPARPNRSFPMQDRSDDGILHPPAPPVPGYSKARTDIISIIYIIIIPPDSLGLYIILYAVDAEKIPAIGQTPQRV
jgi:hypothetical protein